MFKKVSLVIAAGVLLGGCQVTTRTYGGYYDPYYVRPARTVTQYHTNPNHFRPFYSSPVCHTQRYYHPAYGTKVTRRCYN